MSIKATVSPKKKGAAEPLDMYAPRHRSINSDLSGPARQARPSEENQYAAKGTAGSKPAGKGGRRSKQARSNDASFEQRNSAKN